MAKGRVTIVWDDAELRRMASGPAYEDALRPIAEKIAERARIYAPVDEGDYRDSIAVVTGKDIGSGLRGKRGQRARQKLRSRGLTGDSILVVARNFKAHWIEYGTSRRPAVAPIRRAAKEIAGTAYTPISKGEDL